MALGEKLRTARQAAGMSQRQLAGEKITRNMLSQIENGAASPSMDTLRYLAARLEKPVSFFLEEGSPDALEACWEKYLSGDDAGALDALNRFPEEARGREYFLLRSLLLLRMAQTAADQSRDVYAQKILEQAKQCEEKLPFLPELKTRRLILQAQLGLPLEPGALLGLDGELYLHAYAAMRSEDPHRAGALLDVAANRENSRWRFLRGRTLMAQGEYQAAAELIQLEEKRCPEEAAVLLEQCYRELGDYRMAYHYACVQRGG